MNNLFLPFPVSVIGQGFGANADPYYAGQGLKGHPGIDFGNNSFYGKDILNCHADAFCYSVINVTDPGFYQVVYTIVEAYNYCYEISYGHTSKNLAVPGTTYQVGDVLAQVGNTGQVYTVTNGQAVEVSEANKLAGSHAGAHLHFQVRVLSKYPKGSAIDPTKHYVNDGKGLYTTADGSFYQVISYDNGYNGCISPMSLFNGIVVSEINNTDLSDTIQKEVQVLNNTTDTSVRNSFISVIIEQVKRLLKIT